jgi:NAD-dependent deacetylase
MVDSALQAAAALLAGAHAGIAFTGAGVSVESGIPHFRGKGGLWTLFDPYKVASIEEFMNDPSQYWTYSLNHRRMGAQPNPAHLALAELEKRTYLQAVITQNTDGLHQRAGSSEVVELHGSSHTVVCLDCQARYPRDQVDQMNREHCPPSCPECGGRYLKPTVVLFVSRFPWTVCSELRPWRPAPTWCWSSAAHSRSTPRPVFRGSPSSMERRW